MNKWLSRIWEAPQKALAHIVAKVSKAEYIKLVGYADNDEEEIIHIHLWRHGGGMSLSNHIFLPAKHFDKPLNEIMTSKWHSKYLAHEYGHTVQSRKLGPLYLIVVGLPSLIWAGCFDKYREKHGISYYSFFTERWADKLGGVERED